MKKAALVLPNFDARIRTITLKPKCDRTKIVFDSRWYNDALEANEKIRITFTHVGAIDFRINYFDNFIGCEAYGLYEITDRETTERFVQGIFERRKEIYLLEGDYDYDENEPADMLNVLDLCGDFHREIDDYRLYIQNVDAGVYMILAKEIEVERKTEK